MSTISSESPLDGNGNKLDATSHPYRPLSRQRPHRLAHERASNLSRESASRDRNSVSEPSSSSTRQNSGGSTSQVSQTSSTSYTPSSNVPVYQFQQNSCSEFLYAASTTINGDSEYGYEKALPNLPSDEGKRHDEQKFHPDNYNRTSLYDPYKDDLEEEEDSYFPSSSRVTSSQLSRALGPDNTIHTTEIDMLPCAGIKIGAGFDGDRDRISKKDRRRNEEKHPSWLGYNKRTFSKLEGKLAWRLVVRLPKHKRDLYPRVEVYPGAPGSASGKAHLFGPRREKIVGVRNGRVVAVEIPFETHPGQEETYHSRLQADEMGMLGSRTSLALPDDVQADFYVDEPTSYSHKKNSINTNSMSNSTFNSANAYSRGYENPSSKSSFVPKLKQLTLSKRPSSSSSLPASFNRPYLLPTPSSSFARPSTALGIGSFPSSLASLLPTPTTLQPNSKTRPLGLANFQPSPSSNMLSPLGSDTPSSEQNVLQLRSDTPSSEPNMLPLKNDRTSNEINMNILNGVGSETVPEIKATTSDGSDGENSSGTPRIRPSRGMRVMNPDNNEATPISNQTRLDSTDSPIVPALPAQVSSPPIQQLPIRSQVSQPEMPAHQVYPQTIPFHYRTALSSQSATLPSGAGDFSIRPIRHFPTPLPPERPRAVVTNFVLDTSQPHSIISYDTLVALGYDTARDGVEKRKLRHKFVKMKNESGSGVRSTSSRGVPPVGTLITLRVQGVHSTFLVGRTGEASSLGVSWLEDTNAHLALEKGGVPVLYDRHGINGGVDIPRTVPLRMSLPQRVKALFGIRG